MPAHYNSVQVTDSSWPRTVEDAFRYYCAMAGLHDLTFNKAFDTITTDWNNSTGGTWNVSSGVLYGTGSGAGWDACLYNGAAVALPDQYVVQVDKTGNAGGIVLDGVASPLTFNYVYWKATEMGYGSYASGTYTDKFRIARAGSGNARVKVVITYDYGMHLSAPMRFVSVFFDNAHQFSYNEIAGETLVAPRVGFLANNTVTATYGNLDIPQLSQNTPWFLLDIHQPPINGLRRALEGRFVRWFVRYDGSVKAWEAAPSTPVITLSPATLNMIKDLRDWRDHASHARVLGGFFEGDAFDSASYNAHGYRFDYVNNPVLETAADTDDAASKTLRTAAENFELLSVRLPANPLLEVHDHLAVNGKGEWIINDISYEIQKGRFYMTLECRRYVNAA